MKKVLLVILVIASYCSLSAGTPYYEQSINSDGNDLPLVFSEETLFFLCDRTDTEMLLSKTMEDNIPYFFNVYSAKNNEPPFKEIQRFCLKSNQYPTFYSNTLNIAFKTEVDNKVQWNSLYNQAIYENYNCDNSDYSLPLNRYGYWTGQPTLSPSGKVLIFSSNRNGTQTLDLFASIKDEDGTWGVPFDLEQLNTEGNEINPHFGSDGYFYYSSNYENDSIQDYDIYKATYIPKDGVLIPIDGKKLDNANSDADDYFPIQAENKFYFSSTRKAEHFGANIYSIPNEKGNVVLNVKSNLNEIWVKNISRAEYLCFPKCEKINLNKGTKYQIIHPVYLKKYCSDKLPLSQELDFTKTLKDTTVNVDFVLKPVIINDFTAISAAKFPLFVRGYWKPFDQSTYTELRKREQSGFFQNTAFVDTTIYKYNDLMGDAEINQEQILTKIMASLDKFNTFLSGSDSLIIDLKVLSDAIDIAGYKNKYRKSGKDNFIYKGETVTVGKGKKDVDLVIPDGLDITKSSWTVGAKKMQLSNDGNAVLAKLRAYYTYKYLDSTLSLISPIYKYYSVNQKLVFNYDGLVIDEKGDLPKDFITVTLRNSSSNEDDKKIETMARAYDYSIKPESEQVTVSDDPNPNRPMPRMNANPSKISKVKMLLIRSAKTTVTEEGNIPTNQDTTYAVELFNLKDYSVAKRAYDILKSKEVRDVRFLTAFDFLGNRTFLVRADKFATLPDAENALREYRWVYEYVSLEGMPIAVRE
jgi:hypothetical protein